MVLEEEENVRLSPLKPVGGDAEGEIRLTTVICHRPGQTRPHAAARQVSKSDQHGDFTIQEREPVSTLDTSRGRSLIIYPKPLSRPYVGGASLQFRRILLISSIIQKLHSKSFQS